MNFYKRYPADYGRKTARLTLAQHGAYTLLLDEIYSTESPLPGPFDELYRICRAMSKPEQEAANGTAQQVVEVFSTFKGATGKGTPADAVSKALAKAQQQPPISLSDLPGAAASGNGDAERVAALAGDPAALLDFMAGLSPEKQNRLMNSVV